MEHPESLVFFADDAVIHAESLKALVMALESLYEEAKPMNLQTPWMFGGLLCVIIQAVSACGEDTKILENFTYLGSTILNNSGSRQEVLGHISLARGVMSSPSCFLSYCMAVRRGH